MSAIHGILRIGSGLLLAASVAAQTPPPTPPPAPPPHVSPGDAALHQGTIATVCGVVETFRCHGGERVLNVTSQPPFRIVIPPAAGAEKRLEERLIDRQVCVTGRIEAGGNGQQIAVDNPTQITVAAESRVMTFAPHAYRAGCDPDVVLPKVVYERKPAYTRVAMTAGVEGPVWMEAVVEADGTVGDVRVTKPLRTDLDQQAVLAAKEWRFAPATLKEQPNAVIVTIEMTFTLKK